MIRLLWLACAVLWLAAAPRLYAQDTRLSSTQLQEDFSIFRQALEEAHPGLYRYTSKATFDSLFDATSAALQRPLSRQEFYVTLTPLIAALRCGHTKWMASGREEKYPFHTEDLFPLPLYIVGEQAWVLGHYGADSLPAGAEIVAIDGQPMQSLIGQLLPVLTFADGDTRNGKYADLNHYFSGIYATYIGTGPQYEVTYRAGGETQTTTLPAVTLEAIHHYEKAHATPAQLPLRLNWVDDQTALLRISSFWVDKKEQDFEQFLEASFREIKEKGAQHLILDLRDNEGGRDLWGKLLYSYMTDQPFAYYDRLVATGQKLTFPGYHPSIYKMVRPFLHKTPTGAEWRNRARLKPGKPKNEAFLGDVYVLINGRSFSVTTEFAACAQVNQRAVFVGQETSGALQGDNSGVFTIAKLPHANLELGIPLVAYYMAGVEATPHQAGGIQPDYEIVPTIQDVLAGQDPALAHTLELIAAGTRAAQP
ncbi:Peptidase family S41 [Catalinimonas alkaloidigena]|uniref:Peptidase family S41 n=1 Tax=Catalinimonas alkaloidigena TaxID=1075417 RepID=A0A1G9NCV5_9BACT|nr:S41 family peptidase [Catalinimonas alkaloidigena]SDL84274.1 Peptidase family S41 [Catalinimonas alkaloidigena]